MSVRRLVLAGLGGLVLVACSSGKGSGAPTPAVTTTTVPAATTSVTSTTAAATTTTVTVTSTTVTSTTAAGGPYATFTTPDGAASQLVQAWRRGDRARASQAATPMAVASLFAAAVPSAAAEDRGCNGGIGGQASCFFRVGQINLSMELQDVGPSHWRVAQVMVFSG